MREEGFHSGLDWPEVEALLKAMLGKRRYSELKKCLNHFYNDEAPISYVYSLVSGRAEVHALFSAFKKNSNIALLSILPKLEELLQTEPRRIADLGCLTGATTRFLARRFPTHQFTGIERESNFLVDADAGAPTNCEFLTRDYSVLCSEPPFDILYTICGLDLPPNDITGLAQVWMDDPSTNDYAVKVRDGLIAVFRGWGRVSREGTTALCVFRIPNAAILWTHVNSAAEAGWMIDKDSIERIAAGDLLTGWNMTWQPDTQRELLLGFRPALERYAHSPEDRSRLAYLDLQDRRVVFSEDQYYSDGHMMTLEMGRHSEGGYLCWSASTQFHALMLLRPEEVSSYEENPRFMSPPPDNGIVDR